MEDGLPFSFHGKYFLETPVADFVYLRIAFCLRLLQYSTQPFDYNEHFKLADNRNEKNAGTSWFSD